MAPLLAWGGPGTISPHRDCRARVHCFRTVFDRPSPPSSALVAAPAFAQSRIKDIVAFEGVRENQLIGYGVVVGLNGTGDSLRSLPR
ncbi:flagellar basal body P-ring protein FlgI [Caulobacter segnis]